MRVGRESKALGARWTSKEPRPLLLGHRGARHAAPENTFAAFDLALAEGAEGVELDVRMNRSGEVIVLHDGDLRRVTSGADQRKLSGLTNADCEKVRLTQGERLPTLREVLQWSRRHGALVNIEIKADDPRAWFLVRQVARLTREAEDLRELLLVSCFNPALAWAFQQLAPEISAAWLVDSPALSRAPLRWLRPWAALHPSEKLLNGPRAKQWRDAGLRLHVWTVNEPARAVELAKQGVEVLISDNPARLREALLTQEATTSALPSGAG
jgi:glycerophosphoryl diester phosphodiesterase